ncbi:immunoglobulin-like domain-containing protein [Collinsella intestinalis]|uniref:immunoglobulin-like domain-containing protein n=1 Tax=Collinsella intestinalis TaxID=147207 RepID=UPI00315D231E
MPWLWGLAALAVVGIALWGVVTLAGALIGAVTGAGHDAPAPTDPAVIADSAAAAKSDIVIGLNGDADTYVLTGEEYLEAGAHATDPVHGILNSEVTAAGEVDTTKAGDYTVTYTVADPDGGTATAERRVHVVDTMETMQTGVPVLMYHYVYTADAPPENLNGNYLLDTKLAEQLAYLTENEFYFPSYEEVRAYLAGTHSLPAKSIVLTFDDGEAGFLSRGIELLEEYQVPATSFIIASEPDAGERVVAHASPYVTFQSHSYNMHRAGGTIGHGGIVSALSRAEIADDLKQAQAVLGTHEALAYPYGDVTDDARAAVDDAGILCAFTTENRWATPGDDLRSLPRVRISGEYTLDGFVSLVSE